MYGLQLHTTWVYVLAVGIGVCYMIPASCNAQDATTEPTTDNLMASGWAGLTDIQRLIVTGACCGVGVGILSVLVGCLIYLKVRANTRRRIQGLTPAAAGPQPQANTNDSDRQVLET